MLLILDVRDEQTQRGPRYSFTRLGHEARQWESSRRVAIGVSRSDSRLLKATIQIKRTLTSLYSEPCLHRASFGHGSGKQRSNKYWINLHFAAVPKFEIP